MWIGFLGEIFSEQVVVVLFADSQKITKFYNESCYTSC